MADQIEGNVMGHDEEERLEIPSELAILPHREIVLYPNIIAPMVISGKWIKLVDDILAGSRIFGIVALKNPKEENIEPSDLYEYGTAVSVLRMFKWPDNTTRILVQGQSRIKIKSYTQIEPYLKAEVEALNDILEETIEIEALARNLVIQFQKMLPLASHLTPEQKNQLQIDALNMPHPSRLADWVSSYLNIQIAERQEILETLDVRKRLEEVTTLVNRELELLELGSKIQSQVQNELGKSQREYFLREQKKAIERELGEEDERTVEINELKQKIEAANMPEEARKEAERELDRLSKMPPAAAEYTVSRTYLDWLVTLPWSLSTGDNLDIEAARKVLDDDHYDLNKVKDRILEYLAVRKLKADMKGPILCFVGPPGVGKTSLGFSIARALGRKFVRISLGGIRDEAEIRGHRRTYIGALPGRIIQSIRKAGSNNPVFMLDEIDKVGTDFRGDPSAALLEVLDPEQNFAFSDHYLDIPFDLSKVMFITTANITAPIPPALQDRMEMLILPGYIEQEKVMIAIKHLIPKQLAEHGLVPEQVHFEEDALRSIINNYTREAGLRNLEREIANICRKLAKGVAEGKTEKSIITVDRVPEFLGPVRFFSETAERVSEPGVATGMVWTPVGGDILFVESTKMKGKKGLLLTGQLGDVMKESAQAALSYIRAQADKLGIDENFFDKYDIHIHFPEGAIQKDGPSAGVTIATSLVSLLTDRPIRSDIAMTGEITLRGKVLPVGGIKEKVLGARRAGIKKIILPKRNKKDLEEIPEQIRKEMKFYFVEKLEEVFKLSLKDGKKTTDPSSSIKRGAGPSSNAP